MSNVIDYTSTLSQQIEQMELEFPLKLDALALQSKSEILQNWFNQLILLSFPQILSQLAFTSTMVINLGECKVATYSKNLHSIYV